MHDLFNALKKTETGAPQKIAKEYYFPTPIWGNTPSCICISYGSIYHDVPNKNRHKLSLKSAHSRPKLASNSAQSPSSTCPPYFPWSWCNSAVNSAANMAANSTEIGLILGWKLALFEAELVQEVHHDVPHLKLPQTRP